MAHELKATPWFVTHGRRIHGVHETYDEARDEARDLARLMNGVPFGVIFAVQERMGKFAFISYFKNARARGEEQ